MRHAISLIKPVAKMAEIKLCSRNTSEIWSQYYTCSGQGCGPISYCTLPPGGIWADWRWHQTQLSVMLIRNPWDGRRGNTSASLAGCHVWRFSKLNFLFQEAKSEMFNVVIGWAHEAFPSRDIRQSEPDQKPPIPKPNKTLFIHFLEIKVWVNEWL